MRVPFRDFTAYDGAERTHRTQSPAQPKPARGQLAQRAQKITHFSDGRRSPITRLGHAYARHSLDQSATQLPIGGISTVAWVLVAGNQPLRTPSNRSSQNLPF